MIIKKLASVLISALALIRNWKNKIFKDWQWDLLVGLALALIGLLTNITSLILVIPFAFTVVNQFYNKLFEPKDFALRMVFPLIIFIAIQI
jgi:hypothetical protein